MSVQTKTLLLAVARLATAQHRATSAAARSAGINLTAWAILSELSLDGWLTNRQIAQRLGMSTGGVTPALDRLASSGLLERSPHPADRRSAIVTITREGQEHLERVGEALAEALAPVLDGLDADERAAALRLLVEVNDALVSVHERLEAVSG